MDKENLKVSVIICAYTMERLRDIHDAVEPVLAQTLKPYEVIVVVDHNDELFQELKTELPSEVRVVLNKGAYGLSETRNVGIRASTGDIVAFMDDDAVAEGNWLKNLTKHFHDPRVVAVGGRAIPIWPSGKRPSWFPEEFDFIIGCTGHKKLILQENNEVRNVSGCNMAFRRGIFKSIGYWENELGAVKGTPRGGEEANMCLRIRAGIVQSMILYEPKAVVFHKVQPQRAAPKYILNYCLREGLAKAKMENASSGFVHNPLSVEKLFLRHLLSTSLPQRLKHLHKLASLAQIGMIIANIILVGTGYLLGRWKYR